MRIHSIHWDEVPDFDWAPAPGGSFEIWPAPIDADACFRAAGFLDFADSDDAWDADFRALNTCVIDTLARIAGQGTLVSSPLPLWLQPLQALEWLVRKVTPRRDPSHAQLLEALEASARSDQEPVCRIDFGNPPAAAVSTSQGHPLWEVWIAAACDPPRVIADLLAELGRGRQILQTRLSWQRVSP